MRTLNSRPSAVNSLIAISGCCWHSTANDASLRPNAGEVLVGRDGGRARPAVEQRQLAEHRAGRERHQPDVAVVVQDMDAGAALGDEIERRAGIAAAENDMPGRPRHRLEPAAQPFDLIGGEVAQQRQPLERQFRETARSRPSAADRPRPIRSRGRYPGRNDRAWKISARRAAVSVRPDSTSASLMPRARKRRVDIAEDAGAGRIDLGDAPQFEQHGGRALRGLAVDDLRQPLGAAEEQRALQLDHQHRGALRVQHFELGRVAVAPRAHVVAAIESCGYWSGSCEPRTATPPARCR